MHVRLFYPLWVVEYSQDFMPKKNSPTISWPMAAFRWVFFCLYLWITSLGGIYFHVSLVGPYTCSSWVFSIILRVFDLRNLRLDRFKGAFWRAQIHMIRRIWKFCRGMFVSLLRQTGLFEMIWQMMTRWFFKCYCGIPSKNLSVMAECFRNVHHLTQLPNCLDAVALVTLLVASRLPLVMIPRR